MGHGAYSELEPAKIVDTLAELERRIGERFPGSGLSRVSAELRMVAGDAIRVIQRLGRPIWALRLGAVTGIAGMLALTVWLVMTLATEVETRVNGIADVLQASESAVNEIILLALAIYFFMSLETRVKRRTALRSLHRLRSIAHIVDMHQLTKDPERILSPGMSTPSSPKPGLTRFELARYLDYCSELLSLTSKLAALHVQYVNDPVVLGAVNDIEALGSDLSGKVWQKIMILDMPRRGGD